ncbi:hypothetical protein Tco_0088651 [Tanacetum coccineum]
MHGAPLQENEKHDRKGRAAPGHREAPALGEQTLRGSYGAGRTGSDPPRTKSRAGASGGSPGGGPNRPAGAAAAVRSAPERSGSGVGRHKQEEEAQPSHSPEYTRVTQRPHPHGKDKNRERAQTGASGRVTGRHERHGGPAGKNKKGNRSPKGGARPQAGRPEGEAERDRADRARPNYTQREGGVTAVGQRSGSEHDQQRGSGPREREGTDRSGPTSPIPGRAPDGGQQPGVVGRRAAAAVRTGDARRWEETPAPRGEETKGSAESHGRPAGTNTAGDSRGTSSRAGHAARSNRKPTESKYPHRETDEAKRQGAPTPRAEQYSAPGPRVARERRGRRQKAPGSRGRRPARRATRRATVADEQRPAGERGSRAPVGTPPNDHQPRQRSATRRFSNRHRQNSGDRQGEDRAHKGTGSRSKRQQESRSTPRRDNDASAARGGEPRRRVPAGGARRNGAREADPLAPSADSGAKGPRSKGRRHRGTRDPGPTEGPGPDAVATVKPDTTSGTAVNTSRAGGAGGAPDRGPAGAQQGGQRPDADTRVTTPGAESPPAGRVRNRVRRAARTERPRPGTTSGAKAGQSGAHHRTSRSRAGRTAGRGQTTHSAGPPAVRPTPEKARATGEQGGERKDTRTGPRRTEVRTRVREDRKTLSRDTGNHRTPAVPATPAPATKRGQAAAPRGARPPPPGARGTARTAAAAKDPSGQHPTRGGKETRGSARGDTGAAGGERGPALPARGTAHDTQAHRARDTAEPQAVVPARRLAAAPAGHGTPRARPSHNAKQGPRARGGATARPNQPDTQRAAHAGTGSGIHPSRRERERRSRPPPEQFTDSAAASAGDGHGRGTITTTKRHARGGRGGRGGARSQARHGDAAGSTAAPQVGSTRANGQQERAKPTRGHADKFQGRGHRNRKDGEAGGGRNGRAPPADSFARGPGNVGENRPVTQTASARTTTGTSADPQPGRGPQRTAHRSDSPERARPAKRKKVGHREQQQKPRIRSAGGASKHPTGVEPSARRQARIREEPVAARRQVPTARLALTRQASRRGDAGGTKGSSAYAASAPSGPGAEAAGPARRAAARPHNRSQGAGARTKPHPPEGQPVTFRQDGQPPTDRDGRARGGREVPAGGPEPDPQGRRRATGTAQPKPGEQQVAPGQVPERHARGEAPGQPKQQTRRGKGNRPRTGQMRHRSTLTHPRSGRRPTRHRDRAAESPPAAQQAARRATREAPEPMPPAHQARAVRKAEAPLASRRAATHRGRAARKGARTPRPFTRPLRAQQAPTPRPLHGRQTRLAGGQAPTGRRTSRGSDQARRGTTTTEPARRGAKTRARQTIADVQTSARSPGPRGRGPSGGRAAATTDADARRGRGRRRPSTPRTHRRAAGGRDGGSAHKTPPDKTRRRGRYRRGDSPEPKTRAPTPDCHAPSAAGHRPTRDSGDRPRRPPKASEPAGPSAGTAAAAGRRARAAAEPRDARAAAPPPPPQARERGSSAWRDARKAEVRHTGQRQERRLRAAVTRTKATATHEPMGRPVDGGVRRAALRTQRPAAARRARTQPPGGATAGGRSRERQPAPGRREVGRTGERAGS